VILADIMPSGQTVNSYLYIQTLETLKKRSRRVRPYRMLLKILLHHDNARPHTSDNTGSNRRTRTLFPTHQTAEILLPQISTSLEPSEMPSVGKVLGVMTRLLKGYRRGCEH
jgi:hypothetical protein